MDFFQMGRPLNPYFLGLFFGFGYGECLGVVNNVDIRDHLRHTILYSTDFSAVSAIF